MAPHWKCGSGQPVAGSNPALSATYTRRPAVVLTSLLECAGGARHIRATAGAPIRALARGLAHAPSSALATVLTGRLRRHALRRAGIARQIAGRGILRGP